MISWKDSFEKISKDLELAKKKKQALDDLFNSGKISAPTYESLDKELTETISEVEARQKDLADKMASKITDLEEQISTLEMFLANSEIQYAAGEIDEELHASEIGAFSLGLDVVKQQLSFIKEVVNSLMPGVVAPPPPPPPMPSETEEVPTTEEVAETSEIAVETPIETPVEETTEVESVSEEIKVEEPVETPTEEISAEEVAEVPVVEETVEALPEPLGEESLEEEELVVTEEVVVEEETEASTEEESSYEEEEDTTEEDTY